MLRRVIYITSVAAALIFSAVLVVFLSRQPELREPPKDARFRNTELSSDERAADLLQYMTLEEKIGQMALVEKNSIENIDDIARYGIGAVLSGGGGKPENNTPQGWKEMVAQYVDVSLGSRLKIPILYGVDANHGNGNVPGATMFPHAIGLGATGDPALITRIGEATARESAALGIYWHFSPALDLPEDIRWGRVYESFGSDPTSVAALGKAYIKGLQGMRPERPAVLATAKHFIGAGSMAWNTSTNDDFLIDQGRTPADDALLRQAYIVPFKEAVDAGVGAVMVGLNEWGAEKISANRTLITDVLKGELGFQGLVVSDWYGVYEVSPNKYEALVTSVNAGVDMVMLPFEYKSFAFMMKRAVESGDIPVSRIDDAVRRILREKFALGFFDDRTEPEALSVVGGEEHRALAREAVRRSLVLLQNKNSALPLAAEVRSIKVVGSAADNVGMQTGGWTVEWQGIDGNWLPGATSILAGIRARVQDDASITYAKDGIFVDDTRADVGIAIVGEKPYAEGWGDAVLPALSVDDLAAIRRLRNVSDTLLVIIVSGRPLIISDVYEDWDAVVAAWLPGSEGGGVADVLFGDYPFTGTLPVAWPRSIEQLPISTANVSSDGKRPLFERGFGIR